MGDEEMENALLRKLVRAQAVIIKELWEHVPPVRRELASVRRAIECSKNLLEQDARNSCRTSVLGPKCEVGRNWPHVCLASKGGPIADIGRRQRCATRRHCVVAELRPLHPSAEVPGTYEHEARWPGRYLIEASKLRAAFWW